MSWQRAHSKTVIFYSVQLYTLFFVYETEELFYIMWIALVFHLFYILCPCFYAVVLFGSAYLYPTGCYKKKRKNKRENKGALRSGIGAKKSFQYISSMFFFIEHFWFCRSAVQHVGKKTRTKKYLKVHFSPDVRGQSARHWFPRSLWVLKSSFSQSNS